MYTDSSADSLLAELPVPSGQPLAEAERKIMREFLANPFLDDDFQGVGLRLGMPRAETVEALNGLCQSGYMKSAGQRGFMFDLQHLSTTIESLVGQVPASMIPLRSGASLDEFLGGLPLGLIMLNADGRLEATNSLAKNWLGVEESTLDSTLFSELTGFDPLIVLQGFPEVTFSRKKPFPLEVTMHACELAHGPGIMILLRDTTSQEDAARTHSDIQEGMFARMRSDLVQPFGVIAGYLENLEGSDLGHARAAMEQVTILLEHFFLAEKPISSDDAGQ
jgi:hypothetical protein